MPELREVLVELTRPSVDRFFGGKVGKPTNVGLSRQKEQTGWVIKPVPVKSGKSPPFAAKGVGELVGRPRKGMTFVQPVVRVQTLFEPRFTNLHCTRVVRPSAPSAGE